MPVVHVECPKCHTQGGRLKLRMPNGWYGQCEHCGHGWYSEDARRHHRHRRGPRRRRLFAWVIGSPRRPVVTSPSRSHFYEIVDGFRAVWARLFGVRAGGGRH